MFPAFLYVSNIFFPFHGWQVNPGSRENKIHRALSTLTSGNRRTGHCLAHSLCRMGCHWLAGLRNQFCFGLVWMHKSWSATECMTGVLSLTPEQVCSNPWAPGAVKTHGSCPTLPTAAVRCGFSPTPAADTQFLGRAGWRITARRVGRQPSHLRGPREKTISPLIPALLAWPFLRHSDFGKSFPSWFPADCPKAPCAQIPGTPCKTSRPHL